MRTLSVGEEVDFTTDCVNWDTSTNLKDYELVFVNLLALEREVGGSSLMGSDTVNNDPFPNPDNVSRHLIEEHDIVVVLPHKREINYNGRVTKNMFDWLPSEVNVVEDPGESVNAKSIDEEWEWYFDGREFDWTLYFEPNTNQDEHLRYSVQPILLNVFNSAVACELEYEYTNNGREFRSIGGSVYLLPLLPSHSYGDFVSSTLRYNFGEGATTPEESDSPPWVDKLTVPREDTMIDQIHDLESEITSLRNSLDKKEQRLDGMEQCKRLLYEGDTALEDIVVEVLDEVGLEVEGEISHQRDGLIKLDSKHIVLETHGTTGGVPKSKCRQLNEWVDSYQSEHPQTPVDGLFVVNPLKKQTPENRSGYLSGDVKGYMKNSGYRIVLTEELYKMVVNYRDDNIGYERIKEEFQDDDLMLEFDNLSY